MKTDAMTIAKFTIDYANTAGFNVTNIRLQKILYYIQGYFLKKFGRPAFPQYIVNWGYGATIEDVYYEFNLFVERPIVLSQHFVTDTLSPEETDMIIKVVNKCMKYRPYELVQLVMSELASLNVKRGQVISVDVMRKYFQNKNPLGI